MLLRKRCFFLCTLLDHAKHVEFKEMSKNRFGAGSYKSFAEKLRAQISWNVWLDASRQAVKTDCEIDISWSAYLEAVVSLVGVRLAVCRNHPLAFFLIRTLEATLQCVVVAFLACPCSVL